MSEAARSEMAALDATVEIVEAMCSLPAVATQNWCDRAASALLPLGQAGWVLTMLGQVDDHGKIVHHEAAGVAGNYTAQVTTKIGRPHAVPSTVALDPSDAMLSGLRASMSQAKELGWVPRQLATPSGVQAGPAETLAIGNWRHGALGRRWDGMSWSMLVVAGVPMRSTVPGRVLTVEIGLTETALTQDEAISVLRGVMPLLSRRALMAIGSNPADTSQWLTTKEQVILQHLLLGKSVREIAEELGRSPHTVHDHVKALHRKLSATSRGELIAKALGYLQSDPGVTAGLEGSDPSPATESQTEATTG